MLMRKEKSVPEAKFGFEVIPSSLATINKIK